MAFKFESISKEFLTQYRNGDSFSTVTSETSDHVRGNVGDLCQMNEVIQVEVIVNETESIIMQYDSSDFTLYSPGTNFLTEGLFISASVDVFQGASSESRTIDNITGTDYNTLVFDAAITILSDGPHDDIIIRLTDNPTRANYKYGLIKDDVTSASSLNYESPIDGNPQAYYENTLSGAFENMTKFGSFNSWNLTDDLQIKFNGTTGSYFHEYEITHTFRILPYRDGEQTNLITLTKPDILSGLHTMKYTNAYSLGFSATIIGDFVQLGMVGDVGYFDENYNGKGNIFTIDSITITNDSATETLEATETNTVQVVITCNPASFAANQKAIVGHFRCAQESEYANSTETFAEAFTFDSLTQTEGTAAVSSTIIKNLEVTLDSTSQITLDFDVEYDSDAQDKISEGDRFGLYFTVGDETKSVYEENQVNLRCTNLYTKNNNISGIISGWSPSYHDAFASYNGPRAYTNQACWDGDLIGVNGRFNLLQYNDGKKNKITKIESRLVLVKGDNYHILWTKPIGFPPIGELESGGYTYQVINATVIDTFHFPSTEVLNRTELTSVPTFPTGFQAVTFQTSIPRIPWRDWVENSDIPIEFFDETEPNNNLNQKTSNYSDVNNWEVYHELYVEVTTFYPTEVLQTGIKITQNPNVTKYHLRSDKFEVIELNTDGNPSVVWTGEAKLFDINDDEEENFSTNQIRIIKGIATHDLGTISEQDLWGMIWIERDQFTGEPWQLHTDRDWTDESNLLAPSDTLVTGNDQHVELISTAGEVQLICQTNPDNFQEGVDYNVYFKIGRKS